MKHSSSELSTTHLDHFQCLELDESIEPTIASQNSEEMTTSYLVDFSTQSRLESSTLIVPRVHKSSCD